MIEDAPEQRGRFRFVHSLIQQTLAGEISTTRRVRLHVRNAEVIEEIHDDVVDPVVVWRRLGRTTIFVALRHGIGSKGFTSEIAGALGSPPARLIAASTP